jgi:hypothetical protein
MFFICIYLSHVHVARPASVSCSINMDVESQQISSLTFYGRADDSARPVRVLVSFTFIFLVSAREVFLVLFIFHSNISFVECKE